MQKLALLVFLVISTCLGAVTMPAPQYMLAAYDTYATNYLDTQALGRGGCATALPRGVITLLNNPAGLDATKGHLYLEYGAKKSDDEYGFGKIAPQSYTGSGIAGAFGFAAQLPYQINLGLLIAAPRGMEYDSYQIHTATSPIMRNPGSTTWQFNAGLSKRLGAFSAGLALVNEHWNYSDFNAAYYSTVTNNYYDNFDRSSLEGSTTRFLPGITYNAYGISAGVSYLSPASIDYNTNWGDYELKLPARLTTDIAYKYKDWLFTCMLQWEQTSEQCSEFDDRLKLGFGVERNFNQLFSLRAGLISVPQIYDGYLDSPVKVIGQDDPGVWEGNAISKPTVYIKPNEQLLFTAGASYATSYGNLNAAVVSDIGGNTSFFQFLLGIQADFAKLFAKRASGTGRD